MFHVPVLIKEVIELLDPKTGESFIDCTLGNGGHALAIIERLGANGQFLGIDADEEAIKVAKVQISNFSAQDGSASGGQFPIKEVIIIKDNFVNLKNIIQKNKFAPIDGILFDLGMRSDELEDSGRGFSFLRNEPLDMRFDKEGESRTAATILNNASTEELERIFRKFGEERFSKDIATDIVSVRKKSKIATTSDLVAIILSVYRKRLRSKKEVPWIRGGIHPATRVFQALRIATNHELENLEKVLPDAIDLLSAGGRIAIISFHSLEDRIVKHFLRSRPDLKILTKKPIVPQDEEIEINPRSRSAKLRVAVKIRANTK